MPLTLVIFDVGEGIGWTVNYSIFREKFSNVRKNIKSVNSEHRAYCPLFILRYSKCFPYLPTENKTSELNHMLSFQTSIPSKPPLRAGGERGDRE